MTRKLTWWNLSQPSFKAGTHQLEKSGRKLGAGPFLKPTDLAIENAFAKERLTPQQRDDKAKEIILKRVEDSNGVVFELVARCVE